MLLCLFQSHTVTDLATSISFRVYPVSTMLQWVDKMVTGDHTQGINARPGNLQTLCEEKTKQDVNHVRHMRRETNKTDENDCSH